MKIIASRNKREGYYAGYYASRIHFVNGGHKRWDAWCMCEFYPKVRKYIKLTDKDYIKHTGRDFSGNYPL